MSNLCMIFYMFVDGIGFGEKNPQINPFAKYAQSVFLPLGDPDSVGDTRIHYIRTDACLGVEGLPQSATGQTSLWTGVNGARAMGRHVTGFPTYTLKKIIAKHSILKILRQAGLKAELLNCYTPAFFQKFGKNPRFLSASSLVQLASGHPLKSLDDLRSGRGLYMDIDHQYLASVSTNLIADNDPVLEPRDPYLTGRAVPTQFHDYHLAIFEYFLTDNVGHDQDWEYAEKIVGNLEAFISGFLDGMDPAEDTLIVTSDHGNFEDMSTSKHTTNPVPTLLAGKFASPMADSIFNLTDIPRAIYSVLGLDCKLDPLDQVLTDPLEV